ncbi:MAG: hypothetical protein Q8R32_01800 [bacterium]|nr:hypothetical protein [bacterium]
MKQKNYIKNARGRECLAYEIVGSLATAYNHKFKVLELPVPKNIDHEKNQIVLPYYEGRHYNKAWGEPYGGSQMGLELSREIPAMLCDLSKIDTKLILKNDKIKDVPKFQFDFAAWKHEFTREARKFRENGFLSQEEVNAAEDALEDEFSSSFIFSNGDFYPRNFIKQGEKVILIDWQTWDGNYRVNLLDYWENVLAFCFIHMWDNDPWQLAYLKEMQKYFRLNVPNFQKALLIKSFEQANAWFRSEDLREKQLRIFKNALDSEYVNYLVTYTKPSITQIFTRTLRGVLSKG